MKTLRFLLFPLLLVVALLVAGCGGGGGARSVPTDAVAVVGSDTITKAQFNDLMDSAKATYKARKTAFPKVGTTAYKSLSDQAVTYLVQEDELQQKAKELGVSVTQKDVDARIEQIKKQYFSGSEKKYQAQLKAQGLTEAQLRQDLFAQILSEKLFDKVTKDVKVTDAAVAAYYKKNKSQYVTPETREVAHILVNSKAQADSIYSQLQGGADFATLAKKYSKDPGSASKGGELCIAHGQSTSDGKCSTTVTPFDKAAFALKTGDISQPVHSTYGWHIIKALADTKPSHTTPFKSVKETIRQSLLSTKKTQVMTTWVDDLKKSFAKKIAYQSGYAPATTSTSSTATTSTNG
ncbi:MAG TPA: peptidyl-prolyl cis-trans isomerase [Gaiellaceae bacterium]|nr:peptidyl-prolyl cis-trans isomerase [Gaiellaceae bacterium]